MCLTVLFVCQAWNLSFLYLPLAYSRGLLCLERMSRNPGMITAKVVFPGTLVVSGGPSGVFAPNPCLPVPTSLPLGPPSFPRRLTQILQLSALFVQEVLYVFTMRHILLLFFCLQNLKGRATSSPFYTSPHYPGQELSQVPPVFICKQLLRTKRYSIKQRQHYRLLFPSCFDLEFHTLPTSSHAIKWGCQR